MTKHIIGTIEEFEEGEGTRVEVEGIPIAVFNLNGEFFGIADNCPHKNLPLHKAGHDRYLSSDIDPEDAPAGIKGKLDGEKCTVQCPWHQWEWDLKTGENLRPETRDRVPTYQVEVDGENVVLEL